MELLKEKIRKVIAQKGLSLDDIAKANGFSKDHLHKWYEGTLIENLFSHLGTIDQFVEVLGDSMNPTFKHGSLIAISSLSDPSLINWAECYYIVDKNGLGNVRRVYPSHIENSLKLLADNPDQQKYPPIHRYRNHIEAIYKVRAEIIKH